MSQPGAIISDAGCVIDKVEMRPITAQAIERLLHHMERRRQSNNKVFKVKRPWGKGGEWVRMGGCGQVIERITNINLYDMVKFVVKPACKARNSSMVEEMATEEEQPDYFISQ